MPALDPFGMARSIGVCYRKPVLAVKLQGRQQRLCAALKLHRVSG